MKIRTNWEPGDDEIDADMPTCSFPHGLPTNTCLEFVLRSDSRYQAIRNRHYIDNKGSHAQQLHFLIHHEDEIVGIISAGSAVWSTAPRDKFFGITKENRKDVLNGIVNNTVFRLESRQKNLATHVLTLWQDLTAHLWQELYGEEQGRDTSGQIGTSLHCSQLDKRGHYIWFNKSSQA